MLYRCFTKTYDNIPFQVRSVGHCNISPDNVEPVVKRNFLELYWCIDGEGEFIIDQNKYYLHPGEVCFYTYGDLHNLRAVSKYFHYRWITFDGPLTAAIWKNLNLSKLPRLAGPCPEEFYCRLENEITDYSPDGLRKASSTGFAILMASASSNKFVLESNEYVKRAKNILDENFKDPAFNINQLAEQLQINRSQLSRNFNSAYKIGLVQYLINKRIQYGLELITSTNLKIRDIAGRCGFSDPQYFARSIRKYSKFKISQLRDKH
jgi:AraC-like DNA-binding protein